MPQNFYMIGRDKSRTYWKVLKIDRLDPSELTVLEDSTTYTERECSDLLRRIHEGNRSTGGLKFVTTCYGIVGFIKFLGPYYMLVITKRRKIGAICGHTVYAVSKSEMIPLQNPSVQSNIDENSETGHVLYENMFVWNEFLTRGIRNHLQNTIWTVALVYGFFKQETLAISGREFILTLIARRSRHYAGTRSQRMRTKQTLWIDELKQWWMGVFRNSLVENQALVCHNTLYKFIDAMDQQLRNGVLWLLWL
ncbi:hypothetical protein V8G54_006424 [Vigna mungo]|uniref:SAC domain-containing protein n=1 Tax=Vigna mungo TaxID=3915 RepID=A0AAQ3P259_VIGMU